ncbi:hypothetical protein [Gilliamella apicola]|uniref:hypothetical protein n=1 Tax=Gilliamella apicola TaxID=1196095 RepID=UPI000A32FC19|nr:hypothetical protein [Gilliamella apicola]OTQ27850.1 hypothetical protein B6D03_10055 [Gilliamella apicola]
MTIYNISTYIKTKTDPKYIVYEMELYKIDDKGNKIYALKSTGKQNLQADKRTSVHSSLDISDPENTSYILELNLFHKIGNDEYEVLPEPMTAIIPLKGFLTPDKKWGLSREFEYNETTEKTQNGHVFIYSIKVSFKSRAFEVKEHPAGDPLDPFSKEEVEKGLLLRLAKVDYPDQDRSMLCGPAAFFYCLLMDRPDLYKQMVKELWESGKTKIGTLKIEPSSDCRHPTNFFKNEPPGYLPKVPAIDWITLASLRDTENSFFDFDSPDDQIPGITTAGDLKTWFKKAGAEIVYEINTNIVNHITGPKLTLKDLCRLNSYVREDTHVVMLITSRMFDTRVPIATKNHWIVLADKLKLINGHEVTEQTLLTELVELICFSWGSVDNQLLDNTTLADVMKYSYAAFVISKIP